MMDSSRFQMKTSLLTRKKEYKPLKPCPFSIACFIKSWTNSLLMLWRIGNKQLLFCFRNVFGLKSDISEICSQVQCILWKLLEGWMEVFQRLQRDLYWRSHSCSLFKVTVILLDEAKFLERYCQTQNTKDVNQWCSLNNNCFYLDLQPQTYLISQQTSKMSLFENLIKRYERQGSCFWQDFSFKAKLGIRNDTTNEKHSMVQTRHDLHKIWL